MKYIVERINDKLSDILKEMEKANKMKKIEMEILYGKVFTDMM